MTISVSDNTPRKSYTLTQGGSPQTAFEVDFEFFADADLNVYVNDVKKTLTTHYTTSSDSQNTIGHVSGTVGYIHFTSGNEVDPSSATQVVVITRNIALERTTDFPSQGAFNITALNAELDKLTAIASDSNSLGSRSIRLQDNDSDVAMELPLKASRLGKVLAFNATTGAAEAGPTMSDIASVNAISTDIGTLADLQDGTTATNALSTLAGIQANITTVAGIASNVTSVAGVASLITADFVADLNTLAQTDIINDLNTLATADIVSDLNTLATTDIINDLNKLATDDIVSDLNTLATTDIVNDLNALATTDFISDLNAIEAIKTNVTTVANNISDVNTFVNRYRVGATDPSTNNDAGDLFFNTTDNTFKFFNGSTNQFTAVNVTGIGNVVEDTTPQLGGNLDGQDKTITTTGSITGGALSGTSLDLNGGELILDADNDTSITADTDDEIDIRVAGEDVIKIEADGNTTITSNDSGASVGPVLTFNRDSSSVNTNDLLGRIAFMGSVGNSSSQTLYANIFTRINSPHSQNGEFHINVERGGSNSNRVYFGLNGAVFNESGQDWMDFRIESDNNENMFKLDASADKVSIADIDFTAGNIKTNSDALNIDIDADGTYSNSGNKYFSVKYGGTPVFVVEDDDVYVRDNISAGRVLPSGGGTLEYTTSHSQINAYSAELSDGSTHINRTFMQSTDASTDVDQAVFQAHTNSVRIETNYFGSSQTEKSSAHLLDQGGRAFHWASLYSGRSRPGTTAATPSSYRATDQTIIAYSGTGNSHGATASAGSTFICGRESANGDDVFLVTAGGQHRIEFDASGNGRFDGGADISAADYAEYFEWADGNPDKQDRRGYPVILETGGKMRIATDKDNASDIIGIVSVEAAVVGDSAWASWTGKYERDKFGQQVYEDFELLCWGEYDEETKSYSTQTTRQAMIDAGQEKNIPKDAKTIVNQRKKLSADYDPKKTYIPRKDRPEWEAIGLMGKLPLLKGQPTAPQWKKLFDLNSEVEMWLVR